MEIIIGESPFARIEIEEGQKKLKEASQEVTKGILNCVDAEERVDVNDKYPEQTIVIGKQLPTSFKKKLWDLLKSNADVFAWTCAEMIGISRTIMIGRKPFNTEHKLNEFKHIEPIKRKKRGAMYQKLIDRVFNNQISRNLEVHVDDMVIKSDSEEDMLVDIQETFNKLRAINMKLNPRKCSFGVAEGPFLGHIITKQGIKANPSKVKAISDLKPPKIVKEIQSLNEKLAALSLFLSKGADKALPFLKILKNYMNKKVVQWTTEAGEASII
ncbi:hypothetical protein Tco_1353505 [Tanacetum coccineum]